MIIVFRFLSEKILENKFNYYGMILFAGLIFSLIIQRRFVDYFKEWQGIDKLLYAGNIYNEPAITVLMAKRGKYVYDSGYSYNFTEIPLRLYPNIDNLKKRLGQYWSGIEELISSQKFDLIVLDNIYYNIPIEHLRKYYYLESKVDAPMFLGGSCLNCGGLKRIKTAVGYHFNQMEQKKLISICIPTYNGAKTLRATLDSAVSQIVKINESAEELFEIALTDDCSKDGTLEIIKEYSDKYDFIKYFENKNNLGMDGNFKKSALNSTGKFVWYSGQDDIFLDGALAKALSVIDEHQDASFIYFNFSQYEEARQKIVCESVFHLQAHRPDQIDFNEDLIFNGSKEYFSFFNDGPSFLPAIIMKRSFWETTETDEFNRTHYVQYANIILNMRETKIVAVTKPMIRGFIPQSGWQTDGNKLFSIQLGHLRAQTILHDKGGEIYPDNIYFAKKHSYLKRFLYICLAARLNGYEITEENIKDLKYIFGIGFAMYFYLLPSIYFSACFPSSVLYKSVRLRNLLTRR